MKSNKIPRPEYPRPQFERKDWINLNGVWTCSFDHGKCGAERGFHKSHGFENKITVPFCPESKLSGLEYKDFMESFWYHRKIKIPESWAGKLIFINFGAVDYRAVISIDGNIAAEHKGSSSSFSMDITNFVKPGSEHDLVVEVEDNLRGGTQPGGKQSNRFESYGCFYTRTTGIWQTVWLEALHPQGLKRCRITPDLDNGKFSFAPEYYSIRGKQKILVEISDGSSNEQFSAVGASFDIKLKNIRPWSPEDPFLYDITLKLIDENGKIIDLVKSYAGLRKIHIEGNRIYLNNKALYLRFVLDQGFFPDGVWTAPCDEDLKKDIELSLAAGFNGARLHQKVFEERFHYWADKLGYLTWGEFPSWGINLLDGKENFSMEWREIVYRDINHPSIMAWTPFNETSNSLNWTEQSSVIRSIYDETKMIDPSRPVNDSSGWTHVKTDLWTIHTYEQDSEKLHNQLSGETVYRHYPKLEPAYEGQPYLVDEFGGIRYLPETPQNANAAWGYGTVKTKDEFYKTIEDLVKTIDTKEYISGWCYTQLTDVEQEQNGIYYYDRSPKFDMKVIKKLFRGNNR